MLPDYEIISGRGTGRIILGIPRKELEEILGPPDETEYPEDPGKTDWEILCYNTINCSFAFAPAFGDRLIEIIVENGYFHIGKKIRVGVMKGDLLNAGAGLKLGNHVTGDCGSEEFPTHEVVSYDTAGFVFGLDDGIITSIHISPLQDATGTVIWPEEAGGEA